MITQYHDFEFSRTYTALYSERVGRRAELGRRKPLNCLRGNFLECRQLSGFQVIPSVAAIKTPTKADGSALQPQSARHRSGKKYALSIKVLRVYDFFALGMRPVQCGKDGLLRSAQFETFKVDMIMIMIMMPTFHCMCNEYEGISLALSSSS